MVASWQPGLAFSSQMNLCDCGCGCQNQWDPILGSFEWGLGSSRGVRAFDPWPCECFSNSACRKIGTGPRRKWLVIFWLPYQKGILPNGKSELVVKGSQPGKLGIADLEDHEFEVTASRATHAFCAFTTHIFCTLAHDKHTRSRASRQG